MNRTEETPLLIADGLSKWYGRQRGCRDVSFELYEGEVMAVVGESGSGKSTLLQMLSGQIEPDAGRVLYRMRDGMTRELAAIGEAKRRLLFRTDWGYVHQDAVAGLRMGVSAGANVGERLMAVGARHYGRIRELAMNWLDRVEVDRARIDDTPRTAGLLRIDHYLHLRCEVPMPDVVTDAAKLFGRPDVRLASLMDHTPGQRQFRDEAKLRDYYRGKNGGMTDAELDRLFERRLRYQERYAAANYAELVKLAKQYGTPLASHDDTTLEHVRQSIADGVSIAEFPTTLEAALALHEGGVCVLMGAPNLVRGGSHAGNVATAELAAMGALDILSSDYVPSSLLMAALLLPQVVPAISLAVAVRTVTKTPAEAVGLNDRGEIVPGRRADLIRVRVVGGVPAVQSVYLRGRRVA